MGDDEFYYPTYSNGNCPYLTNEEDYNETTIYPKCGCNGCYCNSFDGYCPVRD